MPRISTMHDIEAMILAGTKEDVHLEFKRSDIVIGRKVNDLMKEVSAFANSDGGTIIIGAVEGSSGALESIDEGVPSELRVREWVDQAVLSNIRPQLSGIEIKEIAAKKNSIIVIEVPRSKLAPHQSQDKRYYKRHGSHSYPMEDYEIADVRARSAAVDEPLSVSIKMHGMLFFIAVSNPVKQLISNVSIHVSSNFDKLFSDRRRSISPIEIKFMRGGQLAEYFIGSGHEIFSSTDEPHMSISFEYMLGGVRRRGSEEFFFSDYADQSVIKSELEKSIETIADILSKMERHQSRFEQFLRDFSRSFNSSGIKLSAATLRMLNSNLSTKYDPFLSDAQAFSEILNIDIEMGYRLESIFGHMGSHETYEAEMDQLPKDVRDGLKKNFRFPASADQT